MSSQDSSDVLIEVVKSGMEGWLSDSDYDKGFMEVVPQVPEEAKTGNRRVKGRKGSQAYLKSAEHCQL